MNKEIFKIPYRKEKLTAEALTIYKLDGSDYDRGSLETAQAGVINITEMLGRFVQLLHDKKVLSKDEVYQVVYGYVPE